MESVLGVLDQILNSDTFAEDGWQIDDMVPNFAGLYAGAHKSYTHLDITGEGLLVVCRAPNGSGEFALQIDGGNVYELRNLIYDGFLLIPFKQSLKVTCSTSSASAYSVALVGSGKWSDRVGVSNSVGAVHEAGTVVNVTGSGVLMTAENYTGGAAMVSLQADNGTIYSYSVSAGNHINVVLPFKNQILVTTNLADPANIKHLILYD